MNVAAVNALSLEMNGIRDRTRRAIVYSALVHAALLLFLMFYSKVAPGPEVLTEITWLEPEPVPPAPAPVAKQEPKKEIQMATAEKQVHFERILQRAEMEPRPQSDRALNDKLNERLAALQESAVQRASLSPMNVTLPVPTSRPALASAEPVAGPPRDLKHGEPTRGTPVELTRIQASRPVPVTAVAAQPAPSKPARAENAKAVQNLAGMTLVGPVADRKVLNYATPRYPEWAKKEAVEGSVRLHFVVLADGTIKENVMVQKTSGYEDFDRNAVAALKTWRFEPLGPGEAGEQWGEITFNYRLSSGG